MSGMQHDHNAKQSCALPAAALMTSLCPYGCSSVMVSSIIIDCHTPAAFLRQQHLRWWHSCAWMSAARSRALWLMRCEPAQCLALVPAACQASQTFREVSRSPSATANLRTPALSAAVGHLVGSFWGDLGRGSCQQPDSCGRGASGGMDMQQAALHARWRRLVQAQGGACSSEPAMAVGPAL